MLWLFKGFQIMQEVVANLDHVKFDLEYAIEQQLGVQPLPFTGMDSEYYS